MNIWQLCIIFILAVNSQANNKSNDASVSPTLPPVIPTSSPSPVIPVVPSPTPTRIVTPPIVFVANNNNNIGVAPNTISNVAPAATIVAGGGTDGIWVYESNAVQLASRIMKLLTAIFVLPIWL